MGALAFEKDSNFSLIPDGWGDAIPENLIQVLRSCRDCFFDNLDNSILPRKTIVVCKSSWDYPVTFKYEHGDQIQLNSQNSFWAQHSYQFAHELCHHVINTPSIQDVDNARFGWFEETLCELASLCTLYKMSDQWSISPPYPNWKDYSKSLFEYANNIINAPENNVKIFNDWLNDNFDSLYSYRYDRNLNRIIAVKLFPAFGTNPRMWRLIQYLNKIEYNESTSFEEYLGMWKSFTPSHLHPEMITLCNSLE